MRNGGGVSEEGGVQGGGGCVFRCVDDVAGYQGSCGGDAIVVRERFFLKLWHYMEEERGDR